MKGKLVLVTVIMAAIGVALGVTMWGSRGRIDELSSALQVSDTKLFSHAKVVPWQPDPDLKPMRYYVVFPGGFATFGRLVSALDAKTEKGPMFSSPLNWKLPPGLDFGDWDDSYPAAGTPVAHTVRGAWTVWAKLQSERTFVVVVKSGGS